MVLRPPDHSVLKEIAQVEGLEVDSLRKLIVEGKVVIFGNVRRKGIHFTAVGTGLRTKVNVNVGTSGVLVDVGMELSKVAVAKEFGADALMDLSTGGDLDEIRKALLEASSPLPFGTVPTYQAWIYGVKKYGLGIPSDYFISVVEQHLKDGVDFMTIHAGITNELAKKSFGGARVMPIVSRGGAMLALWMLENGEENPYLKHWDYLLELFREYNAVISLGDALRPGCLADAHDELQLSELVNNARLARDAVSKGVPVMIEGPGHMPLDAVVADVKIMKRLSGGVPYYVLGPLVTDIAAGYDHIAAAIGAAIAAAAGADMICYLTPAEHLSLPTVEQVKEGLIAAKIAAHAGDVVKLGARAARRDIEISIARVKMDWDAQAKLSLDPERVRKFRGQFGEIPKGCTMCGPYCVFVLMDKHLASRSLPTSEELLARFKGHAVVVLP